MKRLGRTLPSRFVGQEPLLDGVGLMAGKDGRVCKGVRGREGRQVGRDVRQRRLQRSQRLHCSLYLSFYLSLDMGAQPAAAKSTSIRELHWVLSRRWACQKGINVSRPSASRQTRSARAAACSRGSWAQGCRRVWRPVQQRMGA